VVGLVLEGLSMRVEARVAQVEILADSALVAVPNDGLVAGVALCGMDNEGRAGWDSRCLFLHLGLPVIWRETNGMVPALLHVECRMLNRSTFYFAETVHTSINCAAAVTLVPGTIVRASNAQRQHRLVANSGGGDDPDGVLNMHKSVHRRMVRDGEANRVAAVTQVEIGADHALVTGVGDLVLTRVAPVRKFAGGALVLDRTRLADVASEWARENRTKTFVIIGGDGRLGRRALRGVHGLEGVGHVGVSGLDVAGFHTDIAQVEIIAIETLVANTGDLFVAHITPDAFMDIFFRRWSGSGGWFDSISARHGLRHLHIGVNHSTAGCCGRSGATFCVASVGKVVPNSALQVGHERVHQTTDFALALVNRAARGGGSLAVERSRTGCTAAVHRF